VIKVTCSLTQTSKWQPHWSHRCRNSLRHFS